MINKELTTLEIAVTNFLTSTNTTQRIPIMSETDKRLSIKNEKFIYVPS